MNPSTSTRNKILRTFLNVLLTVGIISQVGVTYAISPVVIPPGLAQRLHSGQPQEIILELDSLNIDTEISTLRAQRKLRHDDASLLALRASRYSDLKNKALSSLPALEFDTLKDYSHLPMRLIRLRTPNVLNKLIKHPLVRAIYLNENKYPTLAQSLPLINQPTVANAGLIGVGTTTAIIDTGVNYTLADFGSCTQPGVPATCKVNFYQNIADTSTTLDGTGHGTNVSGIVVGVAPSTRIAMINVFGANSGTTDSLVLQGINWAIANQPSYHITAINLSLGDGIKYTAPCSSSNVYATPVANALSAGILTVVSSGNEGYSNGITKPACTPVVISVGAVYDANVGGLQYAACTDTTSAADKIACFSDSANFLSLLAPGTLITTAGYTAAGTSQAAPFVSGAIAVLRSAFPSETLTQTQNRLTLTGVPLLDSRNGLTFPRLNLLAAARPSNDAFMNRFPMSGNSGAISGTDVLATKETGEPNHAGNTGGKSVWWKWTAPAAGQVALDTHGSGYDTLLAVYTGTAINNLAIVASNDNDGSTNNNSGLYFEAQSGVEYEFVVDGNNGAAGAITLNWNLNTGAQANLSVSTSASIASPDYPSITYTIAASNSGPQLATNVILTFTLDPMLTLTAAPGICSINGNTLTCNLGILTNGSTTTVLITAFAPASGTFKSNAAVASDLPDGSTSNNTATSNLKVAVAPAVEDTDIPTLPEWAAFTMACLMIGAGIWQSGRRN